MIIDSVFQEFVKVVQENKNYTIGLLNGDGIVTACSDEEQVGSIHNIYGRDANNLFYPIRVKNIEYGWLWIYGKDENLEMMGNLINDSLNIRMNYEVTQNMMRENATEDDRLMKLLLDEGELDTDEVLQIVERMKFDRKQSRVAIYLYNEKGFDSGKAMRLKMLPEGKDLLCSLLDKYVLLIFYPISDELDNEQMKVEIRRVLVTLENMELTGSGCWVGSVQKKLKNYKESYNHCLWLKDNTKKRKGEITFFCDYVYEFFQSRIHLSDIKGVFDYYWESSKGVDIDELVRIANAMFENNFNISQAADSLSLHKNTLLYKLKKYETAFHIEIRGDFKGGFLFVLIASLMKEYQKRRQIGEEL